MANLYSTFKFDQKGNLMQLDDIITERNRPVPKVWQYGSLLLNDNGSDIGLMLSDGNDYDAAFAELI